VTIAKLASGQRPHHARIVSGSREASFSPRRVRGCFPGEPQTSEPHEQRPSGPIEWAGKTNQPSSA